MKFEDVKEKIMEQLKDLNNLGINESVTLVEGFVNQPLTKKSDELTVGCPSVQTIMLVSNRTGRVYYFALKALELDSVKAIQCDMCNVLTSEDPIEVLNQKICKECHKKILFKLSLLIKK